MRKPITKKIQQAARKLVKGRKKQERSTLSANEARKLANELQIHQFELKSQNEELRRAQLAAEANERKYHDLFEFAPVGLFAFDRNGFIREVNQAGAEILQRPVHSLNGQSFQSFIRPESEKTFNLFLSRAYSTREKMQCELDLAHKRTHLFVEGALLYTEGDNQSLIRVAALDITERTDAAQERERLLRETNDAKIQAEAANIAKDQFLAVISHELRTPLTATLAWLGLLKTGDAISPNVSKGLEVIKRATRSQARLVDDLLDISRIVSGKLTIDKIPVDLRTIANDAVESARATANEKHISIDWRANDGDYRLLGDPTRLNQIISNLLSNAIKFTPAGGRVELQLERRADLAVVSVSDSGIGIPAHSLKIIFDRFHQVDSSITRQYKGLGLGLAISRHLAEMHGGTISAESPGVNCGATFTFTVPLIPESGTATGEIVDTNQTKPDEHDWTLAGTRILVVEDDPDFRDFLKVSLERLNATVNAASSMKEAINAFNEFAPNLILADIGLPDRSGYDFITWVRQQPTATGAVPAIALTAYARNEDRELALSHGFNFHLCKPVDLSALTSSIKNLLTSKRQNVTELGAIRSR